MSSPESFGPLPRKYELAPVFQISDFRFEISSRPASLESREGTVSLPSRFRSWSSAILRRPRLEEEMDAELQFHVDACAEDLIREGLPPDEAVRRARLAFGAVDRAKEECRESRGVTFLETLLQDLRYGLRTLAKAPTFTSVAIATLAVGIGANTAIFSVVYAVLLRPLPYPDPDRLVAVFEGNPSQGVPVNGASYNNFEDLRQQNHVFTAVAGVQFHNLTLTGRGEPAVVDTSVVTPELFDVVGVKPLLGRTFLPADGKEGAPLVVVLSENLWRDRFGADPNIVGASISLDKRLFTVIGIMPAGFRYPALTSPEQIWIPIRQDPVFGPWTARPGGHWLRLTARLKAGVSLTQAQAEMDAISARLAKKFPAENAGWTLRLTPLQKQMVGSVRTALLVLLGAVGLVLLIACANISNLLLARATSRAKEISLRIALGAGRLRIVRQLLTESAVLGLLGGSVGVLLAYCGVRALTSLLPENLPQVHAIRVDAGVLVFAVVLSMLASFVFGLAPAFVATGSNLLAGLNAASSRSSEVAARRLMRNFLAVAEIALALVLLVAAGLLVRSFVTLTAVSPGFNVKNITVANVSLPLFQYSKQEQWRAFSDELLRRLQSEPGFRDTALAVPLPMVNGLINLAVDIPGTPPLPKGEVRTADYVAASPGYFRVMGIPLLRGRWFTEQDAPSGPPVMIISETLAQRYFPNQDPLGRELAFDFPPKGPTRCQIVGVVGDVRDVALNEDPGPMMYVPFAQAPFWGTLVVVNGNLGVGTIAAVIRKDVHAIDKDLPVTDVARLSDGIDASVAQPRFRTWLLGLFGAMALILAAAGIFGVISYSVSRRTNEIGIRITLGATPANVLRLILSESSKLVLIGLVIGVTAALALARFLTNLLFAIRPADPATFAAVALLLLAVATVAAYIPARRATKVDPIIALRTE